MSGVHVGNEVFGHAAERMAAASVRRVTMQ